MNYRKRFIGKFQNALVLAAIVIAAAAMWWNFAIPMTLGLFTILVLMSWLSIIHGLFKKDSNEQRTSNSKRSDQQDV